MGSEAFQKHSWHACVSPMFPSFPWVKHSFQCQFLLSGCKLYLCYMAGNFNKNSSMRALENNLRAQASEHSSNFCEQFEQRPNFASTFKLDGTIRYPSRRFMQPVFNSSFHGTKLLGLFLLAPDNHKVTPVLNWFTSTHYFIFPCEKK